MRKHPQTVQTVHFLEEMTPFCTVCTQWQGNTMKQSVQFHRSRSANKQMLFRKSNTCQTMLEGVCGCIMECSLFLTGPRQVRKSVYCFIAELLTPTVCECDAQEYTMSTNFPLLYSMFGLAGTRGQGDPLCQGLYCHNHVSLGKLWHCLICDAIYACF